MPAAQILLPMFALVALTFSVLLMIPIARFRAASAGKVNVGDFRLGESERVPPETRLPNRNYMNLLELPVLFYVVCLSMYVTNKVDAAAVTIAWVYVALRFTHSTIHLSYNNVIHRLAAFASSNVVLSVLWIRFALSAL
ncbi:MAG: MAPEG family protein [Myxococcales bacterium]